MTSLLSRYSAPPLEEIAGLIDQLHERAEAEEDGNIAPETVAAMRRGAAALRALALEIERLSKLADSYRDLAGEQQFKWGSRNIALEQRIRELEAERDAALKELGDTKAELEEADGMFREICARGNMNRQRADRLESERDAIKRKTIEECAKMAEEFRTHAPGTAWIMEEIAAAIRALAHSESEGKEES